MKTENSKNLEIIKEIFDNKKAKNSKYSLRAFARDLDISVSHLSAILNQNARLTTANACKIALKLDFPKDKLIEFITSTL